MTGNPGPSEPRRTARRAAQAALLGLVAVSLLLLLALGVGPRTGRYRTLTVLSGSMRPAFGPGALLVVTPQSPPDLRPGEVIVYHAPVPGRPVVAHRVVEVREPGERPVVRTKGDANPQPDPWTARLTSSPVWQVRFAVPYLGWAVHWLRTPWVQRATVLLAPALLAALWLGRIWARPPAPSGSVSPRALRAR